MNVGCFCAEVEAFIQTRLKPQKNISHVAAAGPEKQMADKPSLPVVQEEKKTAKPGRENGVMAAVIITLLLLPLLLVVFIGVFVCWRRNSKSDGGAAVCWLAVVQLSAPCCRYLQNIVNRKQNRALWPASWEK